MTSPRPLLLVDASIYLYRAWQHRPASILDPAGRPANALSGFVDTLADLLARERPDRVVCAFDTCGRTGTRNTILPGYKGSRPPAPPALTEQIGRAMALVPRLGVTALGSRLVEADDVIAHFARLARLESRAVTVISGDKDLAQHVRGPGDSYWDFGRHPRHDAKALERRLGVRPAAVPDWLALCGDRADDIPGVPGVGPATAARLIRKWGSLDVLYANLPAVSGMRFRGAPGVAVLLAEHEATVRLARRLTGPLEDPSLPGSLEPLARRPVDAAALEAALLDAGLDARQAGLRTRELLAAGSA